jgi:hypothetical protein
VAELELGAIRSYLNDHRAGSVAGVQLAEKLAEELPEDDFFLRLHNEIKADQDVLDRLMEVLGASGNPVKEAGAWIVEKMGAAAGEASDDLGLLRMVEALTMGIKAKQCLWEALEEIAGADSRLEGFDFERLTSGARSQLDGLEAAQRRVARATLLD